VELDRSARSVTILDEITGSHDVRVAFHLGPAVTAELSGHTAELAWPDAAGPGRARFTLPRELRWSLHRGETDPVIAGWYSAGLGQREPAITLIGTGRVDMSASLRSCLEFAQAVPLSTGDERH
jgi:hypothetical protein